MKTPELASIVHSRAPFIEYFRLQKSFSDKNQIGKQSTCVIEKNRSNSERPSYNRLFKVPNLNAQTAGSRKLD